MKNTLIFPIFLFSIFAAVLLSFPASVQASPFQWVDWIQVEQPIRSHVKESGEEVQTDGDKSSEMDGGESEKDWNSLIQVLFEGLLNESNDGR